MRKLSSQEISNISGAAATRLLDMNTYDLAGLAGAYYGYGMFTPAVNSYATSTLGGTMFASALSPLGHASNVLSSIACAAAAYTVAKIGTEQVIDRVKSLI